MTSQNNKDNVQEQVEVIDDKGHTLRVVSREEVRDKNLKHKSVYIIVKNRAGQFYVNQRKASKKIFPLLWAPGAGGAVSAGESYDEGAERELEEELGIICELRYLFDFDYADNVNDYKSKVYLAEYDGKIRLNLEEAEQGKWVAREEMAQDMKKNLFCPDTVLFMEKYFENYPLDTRLPCVGIAGRPVRRAGEL